MYVGVGIHFLYFALTFPTKPFHFHTHNIKKLERRKRKEKNKKTEEYSTFFTRCVWSTTTPDASLLIIIFPNSRPSYGRTGCLWRIRGNTYFFSYCAHCVWISLQNNTRDLGVGTSASLHYNWCLQLSFSSCHLNKLSIRVPLPKI